MHAPKVTGARVLQNSVKVLTPAVRMTHRP
jgi:hypothetical protein